MQTIRYKLTDQQGNESMQTVLIMAVGAMIMIGVNTLFRQVSPTIQQHVQSAISGMSNAQGSTDGFVFGSGSSTKAPGSSGNGSTNPELPPIQKNDELLPESWFSAAAQSQMPTQLADASNAIRDAIAEEMREHLHVTLPTEAAWLDVVVDDLIRARDKLDPLSASRRAIEEEISALRRLSNKDIQNMMEGVEGKLAINKSLSPVLNALGSMFNLGSMIEQDSKNQAIGRDPNAKLPDAYQAYLDTFRTSSGMLADGVINAATRGGTNPSRASQVVNNGGVQVAISLAADRAGLAIAESAFPAFNAMSHWLYDNGYSPRQPRFPRDWEPPKVYE